MRVRADDAACVVAVGDVDVADHVEVVSRTYLLSFVCATVTGTARVPCATRARKDDGALAPTRPRRAGWQKVRFPPDWLSRRALQARALSGARADAGVCSRSARAPAARCAPARRRRSLPMCSAGRQDQEPRRRDRQAETQTSRQTLPGRQADRHWADGQAGRQCCVVRFEVALAAMLAALLSNLSCAAQPEPALRRCALPSQSASAVDGGSCCCQCCAAAGSARVGSAASPRSAVAQC